MTFGIVGLGRIGTATALRAKALGFHVCFHDPYLPKGADKAVDMERVRTLDELLGRADVLSLHCPLNDEPLKNVVNGVNPNP
jgi:phosphoglycerate dehydrogenase-like enzyme